MGTKMKIDIDYEEMVLFVFKDDAFMVVQPAMSWDIEKYTTLCDHIEILLAELGDAVVGYGTMQNPTLRGITE